MSTSLFDLPDPLSGDGSATSDPTAHHCGPRGRTRAPLAVRMRPRTLDEVVGQKHLLRAGSPLRALVTGRSGPAAPSSVILWGPPGTGKTTIAQVIARGHGTTFVELSAVTAGVKDVRRVMDEALTARDLHGRTTVLFLDEIHRFTKAQQDALLPGVENGWVILVAATTENPSFSVISPLLSRSLLLTLQPLERQDIGELLDRAVVDPRGLDGAVVLSPEAREHLLDVAGGDARKALTSLEAAAGVALSHAGGVDGRDREGADEGNRAALADGTADAGGPADENGAVDQDGPVAGGAAAHEDDAAEQDHAAGQGASTDEARAVERTGAGQTGATTGATTGGPATVTLAHAEEAVNRAAVRYDKQGDQHYDVVSAFIKSIRGSDVDAAMHYLARMIEAGEDPRFIARRLIISASEDIGMADPTALQTAVAAAQAVQLIGMPEGRLPLAQAVAHLATAPKSNAAYLAVDAAIADVRAGGAGPVPAHLRDSHYPGAAGLGHGDGYRYAHDAPSAVATQQYPPDELVGRDYYRPTPYGHEKELAHRLGILRSMVRGTRRGD
ncbi:replication-associated recombination protein A [Kocuria rhizophila]|uniref:replication-associated recombination protein A n=1 Tax=Kocuria rhizophila TaxID=72000 RepID=UPI0011A6F25C|nr:replication-associated recombination protein A [Kocuria rhizophila]MDR7373857.1 putative ATPase [Kocuria rhizophila]